MDGTTGLIALAFGFVIVALVFVLLRDLVLWYFKINQRIANQRRIIQLLERIAENTDGEPKITPTSAAPFVQPHNQSRH